MYFPAHPQGQATHLGTAWPFYLALQALSEPGITKKPAQFIFEKLGRSFLIKLVYLPIFFLNFSIASPAAVLPPKPKAKPTAKEKATTKPVKIV